MSSLTEKQSLILLLNTLFCDKPNHLNTLAQAFSSITDFTDGFKDYLGQTAITDKTQIYYQNKISQFHLESYLFELETHGIHCLFWDSPHYPALLKAIPDAPPVLFYKGDIALLSHAILGVVGPRICTEYGKNVTKRLVSEILPLLTVCSGLARGVDTIAHQTALEHQCPTISVVATGLDMVYPSENKALFQKIVEYGLVLSEYPVGSEPLHYRFPQRNRIISGLSKGVLLPEAAAKSGSLITAHLALEFGRDVFAVPGSIFSEKSVGTNHLIQDGAKLITWGHDILYEYFPNLKAEPESNTTTDPHKYQGLNLSDTQLFILAQLSTMPLSLDDLILKTQKTVQAMLESLTILEMESLIMMKDGKYQIVS